MYHFSKIGSEEPHVILWLISWSSSQFQAHSSPNPWNFLSIETDKGGFGYVIEVTDPTLGWGQVTRRTYSVIRGLELSLSLPTSGEGRGAGD